MQNFYSQQQIINSQQLLSQGNDFQNHSKRHNVQENWPDFYQEQRQNRSQKRCCSLKPKRRKNVKKSFLRPIKKFLEQQTQRRNPEQNRFWMISDE
jgi:hypothetical protein